MLGLADLEALIERANAQSFDDPNPVLEAWGIEPASYGALQTLFAREAAAA